MSMSYSPLPASPRRGISTLYAMPPWFQMSQTTSVRTSLATTTYHSLVTNTKANIDEPPESKLKFSFPKNVQSYRRHHTTTTKLVRQCPEKSIYIEKLTFSIGTCHIPSCFSACNTQFYLLTISSRLCEIGIQLRSQTTYPNQ